MLMIMFVPVMGMQYFLIKEREGGMVYISMLSELEQGQFIVIPGNMEDYVVLNNFPTSE